MKSLWTWASWKLDWITWGWIAWIAFFAVWETIALVANPNTDPLTAHLRPVFNNQQITWFLAFGLWLWMGAHFLLPVPAHVYGGK